MYRRNIYNSRGAKIIFLQTVLSSKVAMLNTSDELIIMQLTT